MKKLATVLTGLCTVAAMTLASPNGVSAGVDGGIEIDYIVVNGPDPASVASNLTPQLFAPGGGLVTGCSQSSPNPVTTRLDCPGSELSIGTYTIGLDDLDPAFYVDQVACNTITPIEELDPADHPQVEVTYDGVSDYACDVFIREKPILYIDKVFVGDDEGGPATASDITLEVYDDAGTLLSGPALADPSDLECEAPAPEIELVESQSLVDSSICAAMQVPPGAYTLGEILPDYGYVADGLTCEPIDFFAMMMFEMLPSPAYDVVHGIKGTDTLCTLTNEYITQEVTVDLVVDNSPGGASATGDQFTIEVFDNTGTKVDEGVDPEPGTGNAQYTFTLPIGPYTFGVSGPDGYDASVVVTPQELPRDIIADDTAEFTLTEFTTVTAAITVTAPAPAPTTTTTTTTTTLPPAPTTAAPAPTTTIAAVLPETGPSSSTPTLLLMALALLLFGGGTVLATRRH